jgi:hypothetical protein
VVGVPSGLPDYLRVKREMEKKNTDYSASAVNLINPPETHTLLEELKRLKVDLLVLNEQVDALIPQELRDRREICQKWISEKESDIKLACDMYGSYQDLDKGWYAVKQRKVSKSYNAGLFRTFFPDFSPAVIIETIDTTKLNGLLKGGLLTEDGLKRSGIQEEKEWFAYIIK